MQCEKALHGDSHQRVAWAWNWLGSAQLYGGKYAIAESSFLQELKIDRALHGDVHEEVATAWYWLGRAQLDGGKYDDAVESFSQRLKCERALHGDSHENVAWAWHWLGRAQRDAGKYDNAAESFSQRLKCAKALLGDGHQEVANAWNWLGNAQLYGGKYAIAESSFLQELKIDRALHGDVHEEVASGWFWLGRAQRDGGNFTEARASFSKALQIFESTGNLLMQRQCVKRLLSIDQNQTYEEFVSLNTKLLSVCQQLYDPADPSSAEELKKVTETLKNPKKFLNKKYENWIIASCVLGLISIFAFQIGIIPLVGIGVSIQAIYLTKGNGWAIAALVVNALYMLLNGRINGHF